MAEQLGISLPRKFTRAYIPLPAPRIFRSSKMACIRECSKCGRMHEIRSPCPPILTDEQRHEDIQKFLRDLKKFEEESRKVRIIVR